MITTAILPAALSAGGFAAVDYSQGVFIVNEDWYGHQNSTVNHFNHLDSEGDVWHYRVVRTENPGVELGCTNQYGQIYGGRFYLIAKQEKDPGAMVTGGRITVLDASTMKLLHQQELIDPSGNRCDGRACLGVDEHKLYISTSNGVWIMDTDTYTVTGQVAGTANPNESDDKPAADPTGSLYYGQCGSMVRVDDRVFVAHQQYGLLIVDPAEDRVTDCIAMDCVAAGAGIGSVVLARDGMLYLSVAKNCQGTGTTLPYLMRVDPSTLATELIEIPEPYAAPANSWYAWTPDGFCASAVGNHLYWNGGASTWFSQTRIYRYDIDSRQFSVIVDLDAEAEAEGITSKKQKWAVYGCSMRPDPVTDELYVSMIHQFQDPTTKLRRISATGETLGEYQMITNYWFPSIPVFPDNEDPEFDLPASVSVDPGETATLDLHPLVSDRDNLDAAIVVTVDRVSDPSQISATVSGGRLTVTASSVARGEQTVTLRANSNGRIATADLAVTLATTGIDAVGGDCGETGDLTTLQGVTLRRNVGPDETDGLQPGVYIWHNTASACKILVR
ncbi:MAG: DUF5074 domain-containing protein [Clostridium sp.]|nr:DUF5074 domain-containing protein [Clostridium sp.]